MTEPPRARAPVHRLATLALLALAPAAAAAEALSLPGLPSGSPPERCRPIAEDAAGPPMALVETFRDDFDDFAPYAGPWTPHFDHNAYDDWRARTLVANHELQLYVDPAYGGMGTRPLGLDPFRPQDGVLGLVARRTAPTMLPRVRGYGYVSGMLSSRRSLVQRHGYFEAVARLPGGAGLWPAFWLLTPGDWPPEIDAMEARGAPGYAVHVHWSEDGVHRSSGCEIPLADGDAAFHAYGVLSTPEAVVFYLDRSPVAWIESKPGFDRPMYMLATLAVGGWAGNPDESTRWPATYALDAIAAWALPDEGG